MIMEHSAVFGEVNDIYLTKYNIIVYEAALDSIGLSNDLNYVLIKGHTKMLHVCQIENLCFYIILFEL